MSFDALAWAARQNTGSSGTKLVLLGLAECADRSHNLAFPSIAALVEFSCLDRKSVISNLARLETAGFISDTGRKVGRTGQIKVWQINVETIPKTEQSQKRNSSEIPAKSPKNGTRNKSEPLNTPQKATPSSGKRASKRTPVPSNFLPTVKDGSITAKAMAAWPPGELEEQIEHFIDRHTATGETSKNWQASWRTWVKNWKKFNGQRRTNGMAGSGQPANRSSGVGLIDAIRESRANREAVPWDAGDTGGMQSFAGLG